MLVEDSRTCLIGESGSAVLLLNWHLCWPRTHEPFSHLGLRLGLQLLDYILVCMVGYGIVDLDSNLARLVELGVGRKLQAEDTGVWITTVDNLRRRH